MGELKWFLIALFVLWALWVLNGGYNRVENKSRPFLEQPAPIEGGKPYTLEEFKERRHP